MSLEFALERYPAQNALGDGRPVEIRPLVQEDLGLIKEFYPSIPEHERMFIKHPVSDMSILEEWCAEVDYERDLPLLVLHEGKVVAEGTLHCRNGGWKKHIGLITILTHPDFRGLGLSEMLVHELVEMGRHNRLRKVETEINGERELAIRSFALVGFRELARMPDYLEDMQGHTHEYILMGMDLATDEEYAGMG